MIGGPVAFEKFSSKYVFILYSCLWSFTISSSIPFSADNAVKHLEHFGPRLVVAGTEMNWNVLFRWPDQECHIRNQLIKELEHTRKFWANHKAPMHKLSRLKLDDWLAKVFYSGFRDFVQVTKIRGSPCQMSGLTLHHHRENQRRHGQFGLATLSQS